MATKEKSIITKVIDKLGGERKCPNQHWGLCQCGDCSYCFW
jgi:hypothetical protein